MKNFNLKRVWVEASLYKNAIIALTSKERIHHLNTVLKLKPLEDIRLFNQVNGEWLGQIQQISRKEIIIHIKDKLRDYQEGSNIILAFALIKQDRLRFLIEKSTELGIDEFIPIITERTTTRHINLDKLNIYALAAAEQSERLSIPFIQEIISLKTFLKTHPTSKILFCSERTNTEFISKRLQKFPSHEKLIILIGPEGGFSTAEKQILTDCKNAFSVSLGENILRAETAAIFAISCYIAMQKL